MIGWSSTRRFTRSNFSPGFILRRMQSNYGKEIKSDGAYFNALFGIFLAWSSTIGCTRYFLFHCLILKRMNTDDVNIRTLFELLLVWSSKIRCTRSYFCPDLILIRMHRYCEKEIRSAGAYLQCFFGYCLTGVTQ